MGKVWSHSKISRKKISDSAKKRYKNSTKLVSCKRCSKKYKVPISRLEDGRGKYCSKDCHYKDKKGFRRSKNTEFKKGQIPFNKGKNIQTNTGRTHFKKGDSEDKCVNWIGDNVGYCGVHSWIRKKYGSPKKCEHCGTTKSKRFEWANISGKYKRDRKDFLRLCKKCHHKYDDVSAKAWKTRRGIK